MQRMRIAVCGVFMLVGVMLGTWFASLPQVRTTLGISYGELGAVLLIQTGGLVVAMQYAGHVNARFGTRPVVRLTMVAVPWFLPLIASAHGMLAASAGMLSWGLVAGLLDVGMNVQAVETERIAGRQIMSSLHAVWGAGALLGSLMTVAATRAGLSARVHLLLVAMALTCVALAAGHRLPAGRTSPGRSGERPASARARRGPAVRARGPLTGLRAGWTHAVIVLGLLGAGASLCESAVSSWCGIFLQSQRGAAVSVASLGYTAFVVAETGTRLAGDRMHSRLGAVLLVRCSLAVTIAGIVLAIAVPGVWSGIAGFAMQGCGIAVLMPIITGAAGHGTVTAGGEGPTVSTNLALARYSTLLYGGAMAGPAALGWMAQVFGVSTALGLLIAPLVIIGLMAGVTSPASIAQDASRFAAT